VSSVIQCTNVNMAPVVFPRRDLHRHHVSTTQASNADYTDVNIHSVWDAASFENVGGGGGGEVEPGAFCPLLFPLA